MVHKLVVRSGNTLPSPFLRSVLPFLKQLSLVHPRTGGSTAVDIGCGAGRNSRLLLKEGFDVVSFDLRPDFGQPLDLSKSNIPLFSNSVDVVLLQYVMMFLDAKTRKRVVSEICRLASTTCIAVVEIAAVKSCLTPSKKEATDLCDCLAHMFYAMNWVIYKKSSMRFLASSVKISCLAESKVA